jgi:putative peptide zinc metalloprotease protein
VVAVVGLIAAPSASGAAAATLDTRSSGPLLSDDWYRVADLCPRWDQQTVVERVAHRGVAHVVLVMPPSPQDGAGAGPRRLRLDTLAWSFAGRLDGARSVDAAWHMALAQSGDAAATQDECIDILLRLYRAGAVQFDNSPDFGMLAAARRQAPVAPRSHRSTLLAVRMPLGNPDDWLERCKPWAHAVFRPGMFAVWAAAMGVLLALTLSLGPVWQDFIARWLTSPHVLVATALAFPLLKALHECAHGLALKRYGGSVPQWGVTWMVALPVPWVDASGADSLPHRHQRLVVSAAGLMAELSVAALAVALASLLQPGVLRDTCLAVAMLAAVTSLAVNANPLLRFDGYHALTDALDLPNLASRSQAWWLHRLQQTLGLAPPPLHQPLPRERLWWVGYAPASLACRWVLAAALVLWAGGAFRTAGWALLAYFAWTLVLQPLGRGLRFLWAADLSDRSARRARRRALAVVGVLGVVLGAVPWPDATVARGIVWLPDEAAVRAVEAGFVAEVRVQDGQTVRRSDVLMRLDDVGLPAERARLASRIAALQAERLSALTEDLARVHRIQADLDAQEAALVRLDERLGGWDLKAPFDGVVSLVHGRDALGRHAERGQALAHVLPSAVPDAAAVKVRVAVDANTAADRLQAAHNVTVSRRGEDTAMPVRMVAGGSAAAAVRQLPSAALGDRHGGGVVTEPEDAEGRRTRQPVWVLDLAAMPHQGDALPAATAPWRWQERVWVRFDHGRSPLGLQALRAAQQSLLLHFAAR